MEKYRKETIIRNREGKEIHKENEEWAIYNTKDAQEHHKEIYFILYVSLCLFLQQKIVKWKNKHIYPAHLFLQSFNSFENAVS